MKSLKIIGLGTIMFLLAALLFIATTPLFALITGRTSTNNARELINYEFFTATTTTATSTNTAEGGFFQIAGAKKVNVYFGRGGTTGANTGTTTFQIQVTSDGATVPLASKTWYYFNKLVQNVATSTVPTTISQFTASASFPYSNAGATSTTLLALDLSNDSFYAIRCIVIEVTYGNHTCLGSAEF